MKIVILSSGRAHKQVTWNALPETVKAKYDVKIATHPQDEEDYLRVFTPQQLYIVPGPGHMGSTRQHLVETCPSDKLIMLDDDLVFATRRTDNPSKFIPSTPEQVFLAFCQLEQMLDNYAHVGMGTREGGNRNTDGRLINTRMLRVLGYRTDILQKEGVRFQLPIMEDFDVTLQLLKKGYCNMLLNTMVHNQGGSNVRGGCSQFRTPELQGATADLLAKMHPAHVTVVEKETKTAWGGGTRKDVRIQWKKAYRLEGDSKVLDRGEGADTHCQGSWPERPLDEGSNIQGELFLQRE